MQIKCKLLKELPDGSAIVSLELDEDAKDWLIGEGFSVVAERAIALSKTYLKPEQLKQIKSGKKIKIPLKKGKVLLKKGNK